MMTTLYPIWIGNQRYTVPMTHVNGIDHVAWVGSPTTYVHTSRGKIQVIYLHERFGHTIHNDHRDTLLIIEIEHSLYGVSVDQLDDMIDYDQPWLELPSLIQTSLPILGVLELDNQPCLVLDIIELTKQHILTSTN